MHSFNYLALLLLMHKPMGILTAICQLTKIKPTALPYHLSLPYDIVLQCKTSVWVRATMISAALWASEASEKTTFY